MKTSPVIMKSWPVARVLLMTTLADWLKCIQSRDFTLKDIVRLHPSNLQLSEPKHGLIPSTDMIQTNGKAKQLLFDHCVGALYRQRNRLADYYGGASTPHPGGFKCFTCQDAADNYECNRWAPDEFCPKGTRYCSTLHMMDEHGQSVSVRKRCATLQDCLFTGCAQVTDTGYQMCSSCCEGNICNLLVPRNESSAVFSSTSPLFGSSRSLHPTLRSYATIIFIIIIIITAGCV